jgi:UDP-N-acetylmuramate dehydrogenase
VVEDYQKNQLRKIFRGNLLFNILLKDFISFRVGGPAEAIAFPQDQEDLIRLMLFLREEKMPFLVLGEGTNLVVRDKGVKGVVVKLSPGFLGIEITKGKEEEFYVSSKAGERLWHLIDIALQHCLTGLEFVSGIPGSVGGAVVMNAGAYGGEMKDIVHSLTILASDGSVRHVKKEALRFSYRRLELPADAIVLTVDVALRPGNKETIAQDIKATLAKRKKRQPLELPSAGSVFKNPPGFYAAQLIEESGLKGYQVGGAQISERHANFIVNRGKATAHDILELIALVQEKVWQEKSIKLEPEIRVVGEG